MRGLNRFIALLTVAPVLLVGGCGNKEKPTSAPPMPSLFAIEPAYGDEDVASTGMPAVLSVEPYPSWFRGIPELVSIAAQKRAQRAEGIEVLEAVAERDGVPPGMRWIARSPPLPGSLSGIPLVRAGARLDVHCRIVPESEHVELRVELHAASRAIWREVEHRSTNTFPFLVGFLRDGVAVTREHTGSAHEGGSSRFKKLAEPGRAKRWTVRVDRASITALLGNPPPKRLGVVVVFSERKHGGFALDRGVGMSPSVDLELPFGNDQVVVRSRVIEIPWAR